QRRLAAIVAVVVDTPEHIEAEVEGHARSKGVAQADADAAQSRVAVVTTGAERHALEPQVHAPGRERSARLVLAASVARSGGQVQLAGQHAGWWRLRSGSIGVRARRTRIF